MKQFLKKFKNFRLTAMVEACAGLVSGIASIIIMILYQTNQTNGDVLVSGFFGEPIQGMIFFLAALLAVIVSIVVVYLSYPFIFKKDEKLDPNKALPWIGVGIAVLALIEFVFALIMAGKDGSRYTVGIIIADVFLLLAALTQLAMIVPTLKVRIDKD